MSQEQAIQLQEEANKIVQEIESQKLDDNGVQVFIWALFAIVAISMIFESFVKGYKEIIYDKKKAKESRKEPRKKLLITYGIHILFLVISWVICTFALKLTTPYVFFLLLVSFFMVEIAPLFTIHIRLKKEVKDDSSQRSE